MGNDKPAILLVAGGTGGHLFPAEALAHELVARGYHVELATDERAERFTGNFPSDRIHVRSSATVVSKNPVALAKTFFKLFKGYRQSRRILQQLKPKLVMGFGGYPTIPPLLAAANGGIPAMVHEQNAIIGRANRALARRIKALAIGFSHVGEEVDIPVIETGNPVRPKVLKVKDEPYPLRKAEDPFRLVVFGGSQGAHFFAEAIPEALQLLNEEELKRVDLVQQVRPEDMDELKATYARIGIEAVLSPFFEDMPGEIAKAHLVVARGGASSVTELAVIGRPSLLVPFPGSLDGDQRANALAMLDAGGAWIESQADLTGKKLASMLHEAIINPAKMTEMAAAARKTGKADAAKRLADCAEYAISGKDFSLLKP